MPLAALGLAPTLPLALALAFLGGGGMVVGEVLSETALPRLLDDAVLARAYGLVFPASIGGIVAGSLIAGPLLAAFGLTGSAGGRRTVRARRRRAAPAPPARSAADA